MSRIGKIPVAIPPKVKVEVKDRKVSVEGPKGKLDWTLPRRTSAAIQNNNVIVSRQGEDAEAKALHGLSRALIQNMVKGVTDGYSKKLEIQGVGYLGAIQGKTLQLRVGFANEVHKEIPTGLTVRCPDQTHIVIKGMDKQQVGQFAAEVRAVRKPEPYKGKGIRYDGEVVRRKAGKTAT